MIRHLTPFWFRLGRVRGEVVTLALAINYCRIKNGETPRRYQTGSITSILAYLTFTTRGQKINIKIPDDPRAFEAYEKGKHFFYARRGQLNMSCAQCHVYYAGKRLRAEVLSPALGLVSHFPIYRNVWGDMSTIHRRFTECLKQLRAKPFKPQSVEYRNLQYFLSYMSNGLKWNGPGVRN